MTVWIRNPSTIYFLDGIGIDEDSPIYYGTGGDSGYYLFRRKKPDGSYKWTISSGFLVPTFTVTGLPGIAGSLEFTPVFDNINGTIYWRSYGDFYVYLSSVGVSGEWTLTQNPAGYECTEWQNSDGDTEGEVYWTISDTSQFPFGTFPFSPHGTATGTLTGTYQEPSVDYWENPSAGVNAYGVYYKNGNTTSQDVKIVGTPTFSHCVLDSNNQPTQDGKRSLNTQNGKYRYGDISYLASVQKWILGEYEGENGWWESETEPSVLNSVTFIFAKNAESEAEGENVTVSAKDITDPGNFVDNYRTKNYIFDGAIWR